MRKYHRWVSLISALFMMFVSATGIALQVDLMVTGNPIPGSEGGGGRQGHAPAMAPAAEAAATAPPTDEAIAGMVLQALSVARDARPDLTPERIDLTLGGREGRRATVSSGGGPAAQKVTIDLLTGKVVPEANPKRGGVGLHFTLQNLHAFYVLGPVGQWISITLGTALFLLSVTGLWMYFDLYGRRARNGKSSPFWS